ncbi:MAG: T9SS type A sorting domain-containing protein [Flavobacteriales bacterium]|nr:T9SS type A sorting domain-containing protein [Flavobacteriales bacterium]
MKTKFTLLLFLNLWISQTILSQNTYCSARDYSSSWDWRAPNYTFHLKSENKPVIQESPWYSVQDNNQNVNAFRLETEKSFEPADGWVLIQRDFGTPDKKVNHPYFILYNKYSGILRFFIAIGAVEGEANSAVITLTYGANTSRSAVLENHTANKFRHALDRFDNNVPPIMVPNKYSFDLPYWMHADFVMNYDPCTCRNLSQLFFKVDLISESDLTFSLNGKQVQQFDETGNGGIDSFQDLVKIGEESVKAGVTAHKTTKSGLKMIADIFPGASSNFPFAENAAFNIIPGLGAAVGVAGFLSGAFKDEKPTPIVYDIKLNAKGKIKTVLPHSERFFEVPGSDNLNLIPPTIVEYNNPMGVFNLIETPSLIFKEEIVTGDDGFISHIRRTYQLEDRLQYVINPAIDIKPGTLDIRARIQAADLKDERETDDGIPIINHYDPISCLFTKTFRIDPINLPVPFDHSIKVIVSFETTTGVKGVYVSTYAADSHRAPLPDNNWSTIEINYETQTEDVTASKKITVSNSLVESSNGSMVDFLAGREIILKTGTDIKKYVKLKTGSGPCDVGPTDPTAFCNSAVYQNRTTSYARQESNTSPTETEDQVKLVEKKVVMYPNPANNQITLSINNGSGSYMAAIIDMSGRTIVNRSLKGNSETFDISSLKPGVYFMRINTGEEVMTKKFIKN